METLVSLVRGVDDELQPRVPGGIDTGREDGVVAHIHLLQLSVVGNDGAAALLTGVELHALRVPLLVVVAVDALALALEAAEHIVVDDTLVVVLQATLADGECLVADERRGNETVTQVGVDAVRRHIDAEGLVVRPLPVAAGIDIDADSAASSRQRSPFVHRRLHLALADHLLVTCRIAGYHLVGLFVQLEGQRRYVHRYGDVHIVRVNLRQPSALRKRGWHRRLASYGKPAPATYIEYILPKHHIAHCLTSHFSFLTSLNTPAADSSDNNRSNTSG